MSDLPRGLYEALVTTDLEQKLRTLEARLQARRTTLSDAEAPDRLSLHLARVLRRALEGTGQKGRAELGVHLVQTILEALNRKLEGTDVLGEAVLANDPVLQAVVGLRPDGAPQSLPSPRTPLLDTTLLTNAPGEPRLGAQLLSEVASADRIDLVMAFIRRSGLRPMMDGLRRHCSAGGSLRILTTTYTLSTEQAALDAIRELGGQVRVSYETGGTRLHAKSWLFHRDSGYSTAFIGSSNLTHSAQVTGMEWNVRVSGVRNPEVLQKVTAAFDSYWEGGDFQDYVPEVFSLVTREARARQGPQILLSPLEIRAEPFQERLLERVALARAQGRHRNLLVSATGTGKTVMAALDFRRLQATMPRDRLLFVAHRKEILEQALATFRQVQRDAAFGELWVDGHRPEDFSHVFASIQSLSATSLDALAPDHFDVVIVDEFHHAAATTYRRLLDHVQPRQLLGLTATPERTDGASVLELFDGRITAELRLWDAIDQGRLCPFLYYGVADEVDLRDVPWRRGRGYDPTALTNLLTADHLRARRILHQLERHVDDPKKMRALGFCVSVDHARFMAEQFQKLGVEARAVWGETPRTERSQALRDLAKGVVQVMFSVDLFNEGVDLPDVDTLLLLRPTDSPTLFLQQLGRGLRRARGKAACTVLDFVGQHRKEYRMDLRYRAILGETRRGVERAVQEGFPYLPAGCHLQLDRVARTRVLEAIKTSIPSRWSEKVAELVDVARRTTNEAVTLRSFLEETGYEFEDIYTGTKSWSDLSEDARLAIAPKGPEEASLRRSLGRLLHVTDAVRIATWRRLLGGEDLLNLGERSRRLVQMLVGTLVHSVTRTSTPLAEGLDLVRAHPQVCAELLEILDVLGDEPDHLHRPLGGRFQDVPLLIHGRYTRAEILAGFGLGGDGARVSSWQTGVRWAKELRCDLFAFTLDKDAGSFSPTTMYRDYAITRELIHWESQGVCRADSATGRRYQNHASEGSAVMLFCRKDTSRKDFWFLGPATYVRHQGERPMAIVWRLEHPLPGDLYAEFKAVAG